MSKEIIVSGQYQEASNKFRMVWTEYMNHEDHVKGEVVNMVKILENDGMTRTQAVRKIVEDHKDLIGFSQKTIYRQLPEDMKSKELGRPNLSHDKLGSTNMQESQTLKALRDSKGVKEQPATNNDDGYIQTEVTYDPKFVDGLIAENEKLKNENFRLKKDYQELETKYKKLLNKNNKD